jgi:hypothetical protein
VSKVISVESEFTCPYKRVWAVILRVYCVGVNCVYCAGGTGCEIVTALSVHIMTFIGVAPCV